jgi:hypothetical protein
MIGFELVPIAGCEPGVRFMNIAVGEHGVDVTGKEKVLEFMGDAEPFESRIIEVRGIGDSVRIADPHQHPRYASRVSLLCDYLNIKVTRDADGIDGKCRNPALPDNLLALKTREQIRITALHLSPLRTRLSAFLASSSIKLSATSRSSDVRRS